MMAWPRGRGDICRNGPPARHFQKGDRSIFLGEGLLEPAEMQDIDPIIVIVEDDANRKTSVLRPRHNANGS